MDDDEYNPDFVSVAELLSNGMGIQRIVNTVELNPLYTIPDDAQYDDLEATEDQREMVLVCLKQHLNRQQIEREIRHLSSKIKRPFIAPDCLDMYGWPSDEQPEYALVRVEANMADLPEINPVTLRTEGRFVAALMNELGYDLEALQARDRATFKALRDIATRHNIDRGTLANMLKRWKLRPLK